MDNKTRIETKTDNELIAEFMGWTMVSTRNADYWEKPGDSAITWHEIDKFSSCWDWLMPVVEKIGRIELPNGQYANLVDFSITTNDGIGWIFWTKGIPGDQNQPQSYSIEGTMIERTYKAVVEFIKWYNVTSK